MRGSRVTTARVTMARVAFALAGACVIAAGCSLGLDPSLIGGVQDAGTDAEVAQKDGSVAKLDGGTPAMDAGGDSGLATTCAKDGDCFSNQACLTGRCDLSRGACVYDVCPTQGTTCSSAVCNNGMCGAPVEQKFASAKPIAVPAGVSCNTLQRCFVSVHPWVFVGTNAGVLAYPAIPADPNPTPVVVSELPFLAQSITVSGNRVYVLGGIQNNGLIKAQIAWFDAPLDPQTKAITAHSTFVTTNHQTGDVLLPLPSLSALLTQQGQPNPLYAGIVTAPFTPQSTISQVDADAGAVASQTTSTTGARLALFKTNGMNSEVTLLTSIGTVDGGASASIDTTAALPGGVQSNYNFATGADGSLRIHYYTYIPMGMVAQYKTHVAELFENGTATTLSAKFAVVDIDTYTTPLGGAFLGNVAWVDSSSVLTASSTPPNSAANSSHVLWIDNKKTTPKALNLMTPYQNIAVAGSAGIGWALTNDQAGPPPAQPGSSSLYYLSPLCPL